MAKKAKTKEELAEAAERKKKLQTEAKRKAEERRELLEQQARKRRALLPAYLNGGYKDGKNIDYLKKTVVPIVHSTGMRVVADEADFVSYQIKIKLRALARGEFWALHSSKFGQADTVCLITVLNKVPIDVRNQYPNSTKCMKFLMDKPAQPSLIKLYDIFSVAGQKMYTFMEPVGGDGRNAAQLVAEKKGKPLEGGDVAKWACQLAQAYAYMHSFAIAHLNIRTENVLFDSEGNAKVAGMSRAFLYFSLDQRAFEKPAKVENEPYNCHLPPEAFEGPFNAQPADVYSLGVLIYELATGSNPLKAKVVLGGKQVAAAAAAAAAGSNKTDGGKAGAAKKMMVVNRYDPKLFDFAKLSNAPQRSLVERMLSIGILGRPKFTDILSNEYIGANGSDGRIGGGEGSPAAEAEQVAGASSSSSIIDTDSSAFNDENIRLDRKDRMIICPGCNVAYSSTLIRKHFRRHHSFKLPFECVADPEECSAAFAVIYKLQEHQKIHHGGFSYLKMRKREDIIAEESAILGMKVITLNHKVHAGTNINEPVKPLPHFSTPIRVERGYFFCPFNSCQKTCIQVTKLIIHHRTHYDARPYACLFDPAKCAYKASEKANVKKHLLSRHSTTDADKYIKEDKEWLANEKKLFDDALSQEDEKEEKEV